MVAIASRVRSSEWKELDRISGEVTSNTVDRNARFRKVQVVSADKLMRLYEYRKEAESLQLEMYD